MSENSLSKLGGNCSLIVGVFNVLVGITYLLLAPEYKAGSDFARLFPAFVQNPTPLMIFYWELALTPIFGIAAVLAISEQVRKVNEEWVRWTSNLAILGFSVTAISYFRAIALQPKIAAAYVAGDASTKAALVAPGGIGWYHLDPYGWFGWGAVGFWILVVCLLAFRSKALPRALAVVGMITTIGAWLVVAGFVLNIEMLVAIASVLGGIIFGTIWYVWNGVRLLRAD